MVRPAQNKFFFLDEQPYFNLIDSCIFFLEIRHQLFDILGSHVHFSKTDFFSKF